MYYKKKILIWSLLFLFLINNILIVSIGKINIKKNNKYDEFINKFKLEDGLNILAVGSYNDGFENIPCCWINDKKIEFDPDEIKELTSIYVYNNNIYISGTKVKPFIKSLYACYWINGKEIILNSDPSSTKSIFVDNTGIYVSGSYISDNYESIACYWKNNELIKLHNNASRTSSIIVKDSNIYVSGYYYVDYKPYACYWKNNKIVKLSTNSSISKNIIIKNSDVINVGYINSDNNLPNACFWKNENMTKLSEDISEAKSVAINDNELIIIGYYKPLLKTISCVWKNNIKYDIFPSNVENYGSEAASLVNYNSKIYIGGFYYKGFSGSQAFIYTENKINDIKFEDSKINSICVIKFN